MSIQPVKTALVGCGNISDIYFENAAKWDIIDMVACANRTFARAEEKAKQHNIPQALSIEDALADPDIELIINLTTPDVHAEIGLAALRAGKSVYNEKPLAIKREDAKQMLTEAEEGGLLGRLCARYLPRWRPANGASAIGCRGNRDACSRLRLDDDPGAGGMAS